MNPGWAQRKIPVVFNIGQKNGSISGRLLEKHASGQKNGLIYGHLRQKAGGASPWAQLAQPVSMSRLAYLPAAVPDRLPVSLTLYANFVVNVFFRRWRKWVY